MQEGSYKNDSFTCELKVKPTVPIVNLGEEREGFEGIQNIGSKSCFRSEANSISTKIERDDGQRKCFTSGQLLETIKIKYCTTVGLIIDGILEEPPHWEWYKLLNPQLIDHKTIPSSPPLQPQILKKSIFYSGYLSNECIEYEMFDLTDIKDSDDNEEDDNDSVLSEKT